MAAYIASLDGAAPPPDLSAPLAALWWAAKGDWDHAQQLANGWSIRVATLPEAILSAMALFVDVARGNTVAAERRIWRRSLLLR